MNNAITWFEIPATDLKRASEFYAQVIDKPLIHETMGETEMAVFPFERNAGIGGCVTHMEPLKPSTSGSVVYLYVGKDLDAALSRTWTAGGKVVLGKTALPGDLGHFAHIIDSEGNRVGLHAA
jgi:predicted enzyme related to lactoylglutathione lyase